MNKTHRPWLRRTILALIAFGVVALILLGGQLYENVDASEIIVMQDPIDGELHVHRTSGWKPQFFAKVTRYQKSNQYVFADVPLRFNDKGKATVSGDFRWDMPTNDAAVLQLHELYGSKGGEDAIEQELMRPTIVRSLYMTGPLMSSTESAATRRPELIDFVMDQARFGVYRTFTREEKTLDTISGQEKTIQLVELVEDPEAPGGYDRQEPSPVEEFNITLSNFSISGVDYDDSVDTQINKQRELEMEVQNAIAQARTAEQAAITAEKNGQARSAEARWEQEVFKAKAITAAEQARDVAALGLEEAKLTRQTEEELGRGEAARKRLVMEADGALDKKLAAYVKVSENWANAYANSKHPPTPSVVMGGNGASANGVSGVEALMQVLGAQAAKDLGLNLKVAKTGN